MQLRLVSWFFITLNLMEYVGSQQPPSRVRRQGRMHRNMSQACQGGCATCSEYNGCMSCIEEYECKADCEACFNKNFCTKCKNGFYLRIGKCLESCPDWLEPNNSTMECSDIVHCKVNEWSQWSPCTKRGKSCGFKRGNETRSREVLQLPSAKGKLCPHTTETRKCVVQKKKCLKGVKGPRKERRKKPKREESKETSQENRGQESTRQNQEQENKSKTPLKKRRAQDKQQKPASVSTAH
uniref:R-spondin 3 n=1 Tax=Varanus komodoensis TaxID=61221 RepID=A0A8D2J3D2_VARKO